MERAPHMDGWSHKPRARGAAVGREPLGRSGEAPRRTEVWRPEQSWRAGKSIPAEGTTCAESLRQEERGHGCRGVAAGVELG